MRNSKRTDSSSSLTIVVKLGTSSIVSESTLQPQLSVLSSIAEAICDLRAQGHRVVLVSSGAIGMGLKRMKLSKRPKALADKQALAAIGQGRLVALYDTLFGELGQPIAQILLTRNDISDRSRYLNATKTLNALLAMGVLPIVNENDTIAVQEIKFGDNDTLSAITAGMVMADYLFLLTDVDCLYTENPRRCPTAQQVLSVRDIEVLRAKVSTSTLGSSLGTGGMETKLIAAELATGAGVATVICHSSKPSNIARIIALDPPVSTDPIHLLDPTDQPPEPRHTLFVPNTSPIPDRRWWIMHGLAPKGRLIIDEGAYRAIFRSRRASSESGEGNGGRLLPAGVLVVEGSFAANQAVRIAVRRAKRLDLGQDPGTSSLESSMEDIRQLQVSATDQAEEVVEVGQGMASYNWQEIERIKGHKSSEIEKILGYTSGEHVVEHCSPLQH